MTAHAKLLLMRHGESETNAANVFTGWSDPSLTAKGEKQCQDIAARLVADGLCPNRVFCSTLQRCRRTTELMLGAMEIGIPVTYDPALNERDYGSLTGLNKAEAARLYGVKQVRLWRRSYVVPPPGGESLRDTAARVLAYYVHTILPAAMEGGTTLIVSHGNTLRALVMALDGRTVEEIEQFDIFSGATLLYELASTTAVRSFRQVA